MSENIPISVPDLSGREAEYVHECVKSGWVSSIGPFVARFEREFAAFCRVGFGVSVNSGTAALHLALRALGVGPGDEVIIPGLTFASTANCIIYQGGVPVFADCARDDWNMDADALEKLITERTAAIVPVHLYGSPCEMQRIMAIADAYSIPVVEDCAEAHGAQYRNARVGSFGRISCFSFYGNKIITTGEGGMCVTADPELDGRLRFLRDHGMSKTRRYWHDEIGFNYRMTNLQAAVGCAQLERIQDFIDKKRWIADEYREQLEGSGLNLPKEDVHTYSVYWLYTVILPAELGQRQRDELIQRLAEHGIDARPVFYPLTQMPPYRAYETALPNSESLSARGVTLPSFYTLGRPQIRRITGALLDWLAEQ
ncbi:MAG: DegT/DnrJ/EryC1/StrS family aminotransferase [Gammaproteobacteria bacterium]|nr:DegT/DnrJ/EryC1/StrS family aminotransferase [Gammaproteobacteria bacterium]NIR84255.1 DegT/DnrJ/EryC1/StrS family aminotransferase [Gammaproteobacteria bacterium]NIR89725.1 DegT/DnrJ/EryC1/StrS family aminotransferase [Gammaproteobacteria bacterium]NIU05413.1 DegT/DnrJ/EryC1/StrS family aminotransferase [Gammaproteobacteria bacterium]NIV52359.1 aminotransferase class I/II-fold pyridoxal phosphate-dependent enzyme [Gammaproteobacteria bacterium]